MHTRSTARLMCQTPVRRGATSQRGDLSTVCVIVALFLLAALLCAHAQAIVMESDVPTSMPVVSSQPALPMASAPGERRPLALLAPVMGGPALFFPLPSPGRPARATAAPALVRLDLMWKLAPLLLLLLLLLAPRRQGRLAQNVRRQLAAFLRRRQQRTHEREQGGGGRKGPTTGGGERAAAVPAASMLPPGGTQSKSPVGVTLPATAFADVAGIDEVRGQLEEIVQFLRSPQKFERLGAHLPRGALLVGAPGTGKTLLARAVAGEADVPFLSISASELVEVFVGVGASRVRTLFQKARHLAPALIFIDELDAVGRKRSMKTASHDEREQTLNQLLVEMDGFRLGQAVVVLAATNRVDILDEALLRPGRFDRHISVPLPDCAGRQAILALHTARVPLHEEVALEYLARQTVGMSGAELASLVNEAALCAARRDLEHVDQVCFEQALARLQLGAQRPLVMTETEQRVTACHEGGHALLAYYLPEAGTVNGVTILPRGQSLGVTHLVAEGDCYNASRQRLMARIAVALGGRVAEELVVGREHVTIGAESDLRSATALARRMVTRWGMGEELGATCGEAEESGAGLCARRVDPTRSAIRAQTLAIDARGCLAPGSRQVEPAAFRPLATALRPGRSLSMSLLVEREVRKILDEGYGMARQILQEHAAQLQALTDTLIEREQLNRAEFEAVMGQGLAPAL